MELKDLSSNWRKLQVKLNQNEDSSKKQLSNRAHEEPHGVKRRRLEEYRPPLEQVGYQKTKAKRRKGEMGSTYLEEQPYASAQSATSKSQTNNHSQRPSFTADRINEGLSPTAEIGKYVAIDCEMVGVGPNPDRESSLARVSAVNFHGDQVYDSYVKQKEDVTDWRTHVSGILPKHMLEARTLEQVQADISALLDGNILVGHAIRNDLDALKLGHPRRDIRDTARHKPFRKLAGGGSPKLKILAAELLGINIQGGEHSSVEDARACMLLFRREKDAFEREHAKKWPTQSKPDLTNGNEGGEKKARKRKKKKK